ncbi:MAG: RNA polymerase sigma factor [Gammaproteobacteria bacterium]|nr:RNA polymerase sigma factor [Gammaproteobacteria bacterium]
MNTSGLRLGSAASVAYSAPMTAVPEDAALMLRYKDGDVSAFETLYRRHNDALYRYLLRLCQNRETAEDLYQEAWGKIIKSRENYRPTAKFTTFLYRVAHNCFIDFVRRNKRHTMADASDPDELAHGGKTPEDEVEVTLARQRLEAALATLPDEQRDVFLLHEEAGLGIDDIGLVTGVNRETAKSRLRYAIKKLRVAMEDPALAAGGGQ